MKKIALLFAALALAFSASAHDGSFSTKSLTSPSRSALKLTGTAEFTTAYMFRGDKLADDSVQASVEISYEILGFDAYAGAWATEPLHHKMDKYKEILKNLSQVDFYGGLMYSLYIVVFDVGYQYFWYPYDHEGKSYQNELYGGITLDTTDLLYGFNITPSIYYYYNFQLDTHNVEASLSYEFPLGSYMGFGGLTMPISANYAFVKCESGAFDQYMYAGATIDLAYSITRNFTISGGARYCRRFNERGCEGAFRHEKKDHFWYGVKIEAGF